MSTTVWRISKQKYATTAFSGIGAKLVGGRWNSKGCSIVYTSATLSLAALETGSLGLSVLINHKSSY